MKTEDFQKNLVSVNNDGTLTVQVVKDLPPVVIPLEIMQQLTFGYTDRDECNVEATNMAMNMWAEQRQRADNLED